MTRSALAFRCQRSRTARVAARDLLARASRHGRAPRISPAQRVDERPAASASTASAAGKLRLKHLGVDVDVDEALPAARCRSCRWPTSPKRQPIASMQSQRPMTRRTNGGAWAPKPFHRNSGWSSGNTPLPWNVVATGAPSRSASGTRSFGRTGGARPDVERRMRRLAEHSRRALHELAVGPAAPAPGPGRSPPRRPRGSACRGWPGSPPPPGPARPGARAGRRDGSSGRSRRRVSTRKAPLVTGREHRELVDVVQLVGMPGVAADAAGQHHHRHLVHERLGDARQAVA